VIRLFRVRGIPVRVDYGWLLIFGLISWSLASGYFPRVTPDLSPAAYWGRALAAAVLLFVSVLLHELSHALVALRHDIAVSGITLHVFGGVSELENDPTTPRAEFLIAIVGPLTSFAIAGVCWALGRALASGPAWAFAVTGYLALVNVLVGAFNLVPGFPLDGGRILRSVLWAWRGRVAWATRWASRAGSAFAGLLVALGMIRALGGDLVSGLWLVMVGMFLHQAAQSSEALARVRARLEPLRVEEIMTPVRDLDGARAGTAPVGADQVVGPRDSAWLAFLKVSRHAGGHVAVVDGGRLVGMLRRRDFEHVASPDSTRRAAAARRAA
jgi:Zn-dependent protease